MGSGESGSRCLLAVAGGELVLEVLDVWELWRRERK